jgi:hypothetical protein
LGSRRAADAGSAGEGKGLWMTRMREPSEGAWRAMAAAMTPETV